MNKYAIKKKTIANLGLVLALIVVFSYWWLKRKSMSIWGLGIILILVLVLFYYSWKKSEKREGVQMQEKLNEMVCPQDYIFALSTCRNRGNYQENITAMIGQTERFVKKQKLLFLLLYQNFKQDDIFFSLTETVNQVENRLFYNIKSVLDMIYATDEGDTLEREASIRYVSSIKEENGALVIEFEALFQKLVRTNFSEQPNELSWAKDFIHILQVNCLTKV